MKRGDRLFEHVDSIAPTQHNHWHSYRKPALGLRATIRSLAPSRASLSYETTMDGADIVTQLFERLIQWKLFRHRV